MKKLFVAILLFSSVACAQSFGGIYTPNDTLQSVRLLPNNQVVLSIYAPNADIVTVSGDFNCGNPALKLKNADNGVWSVWVSDVMPEVYTYAFNIHGVRTFDPKNPLYQEGEKFAPKLFR